MKKFVLLFSMLTSILSGCAGMKVVDPDKEKNKGTLALDLTGGSPKLVGTYTCSMDSMGTHFSSVAKTETDAKNDVMGKCRDHTLISMCDRAQIKCFKN